MAKSTPAGTTFLWRSGRHMYVNAGLAKIDISNAQKPCQMFNCTDQLWCMLCSPYNTIL